MDPSHLERLGNLHLVVLHLPIGFVAAIVLVEGWRWRHRSPEIAGLQGLLLAVNAIAALAAAGFGLLLAGSNQYPPEQVDPHRWAGVVCAGFAVASWFAHRYAARWLAGVALLGLVASTIAAGHLGATLTHGEAVTAFWPVEKVEMAQSGGEYAEVVQPILAKYCYECHGNEKQKGKLRLDIAEAAKNGGKSGKAAIVPGKPAESELIRRVTLPRGSKGAMPPADFEAPKPQEIAAIERWIAGGANSQ